MGFLDEAKGLADQAKDLAEEHSDQVDQAVQRAGDLIDDKTDDKFKSQIDQGQQFIEDQLGKD
jgi:MT0933-like antitoxin protein